MVISENGWKGYADRQRQIVDAATGKVRDYLASNGTETREGRNQLISYSYAVATKYGEAGAALAAEMYDEVAEASGADLPAAEPAETATIHETAKAVAGTLKTGNDEVVAGAVGRLVKTAGVDTTMKNAIRDGAEWAWVPQGEETCAFCIMLASRGWQRASKAALKNGHAEHIHAHCDCQYAVRFDSSTEYAGYNPEKYLAMYDGAEGDTWEEKLGSMRRAIREENKDEINTQKRALYARSRRLHYGEKNRFETDGGVVNARRVDKYGYNNIYVDESVTLTERQLRVVDQQISAAKKVIGITNTCDALIVVSDIGDVLASYNPRTNILLISTSMTSEEEIIKRQQRFACPNDTRSTAVHELLHWKDADEYKNSKGPITDASEKSDYSIFQREKSLRELSENGIDVSNNAGLRGISEYAYISALDNDWEEVYIEFRTKEVLT